MPCRLGRLHVLVAATLVAFTAQAAVASDPPPLDGSDICLVLAAEAVPSGAWTAVTAAIDEVVWSRPELFPDPAILASEPAVERTEGDSHGDLPSDLRLRIRAGHGPSGQPREPSDSCEREGRQWLARVDRDFLEAGAERMLEQAPTTPGIESSIHLEWHPDETLVRTRLEFAGPLDIPNGECWIDDRLVVDTAVRQAVSRSDRGLRTSPFAEAACGRFFEELDRGGAGEQAVTLLPVEVHLADGTRLRFEVHDIRVEDDAIIIAGALAG